MLEVGASWIGLGGYHTASCGRPTRMVASEGRVLSVSSNDVWRVRGCASVPDWSAGRYFQLRILSLFTPLLAFTFASALPSGPKDQTMAGSRTRSTLPPFSKR